MVVSAGCYVFQFQQKVFCWLFALGAAAFTIMQSMQIYEGNNPTIKRLRRIMALADIFFVLSAILMIDSSYNFLMRLFNDYFSYIQYVYNKWVITLLIAAVLEMYSTHRISSELSK